MNQRDITITIGAVVDRHGYHRVRENGWRINWSSRG